LNKQLVKTRKFQILQQSNKIHRLQQSNLMSHN